MFKLDRASKVIIDPEVIGSIPAFTQLWNSDESESKEHARALLTVIYHNVHPNSEYSKSDSYIRETKIITDLFHVELSEWYAEHQKKPDPLFMRALKYYESSLQLAPERNLLFAAQDAVHDLANKIRDPKTKNKEKLLETMVKTMKNLKEAQEMVKAEEEKQKHTRGGHATKPRENPQYVFEAEETKTKKKYKHAAPEAAS